MPVIIVANGQGLLKIERDKPPKWWKFVVIPYVVANLSFQGISLYDVLWLQFNINIKKYKSEMK